jgi:RNA polymerase subunit RPABC4/transcription elongation factor Spt4
MDSILANLDKFVNWWYIMHLFLFPLIFVWIWWVFFVSKDISHRTNNVFYQIFCILLSAIPVVWFMLYFIIRPHRTLDDINWRVTLADITHYCSKCGEYNHKDNHFCISCGNKLLQDCKECNKQYSKNWEYCPHCGAPSIPVS